MPFVHKSDRWIVRGDVTPPDGEDLYSLTGYFASHIAAAIEESPVNVYRALSRYPTPRRDEICSKALEWLKQQPELNPCCYRVNPLSRKGGPDYTRAVYFRLPSPITEEATIRRAREMADQVWPIFEKM